MVNMKDKLKSMFTEYWKYLAVNAACKLSLFDKISQGQNTLDKLCEHNQWDRSTLLHLTKFLLQEGYLEIEGSLILALTEKGDLLRESNEDGLYYACLNWSGEHLTAWQNIEYSIQTGKSSFEKIYGLPFFDYLNENPEKLHAYHKAMYEYAKDDYKTLPDVIDFSKHKSVIDIGGGYGAVVEIIKAKNPSTECILFDLEKVIDRVNILNIRKVSGNFFQKIPINSEAIILSRVLHDWNDEKAMVILNNCYNAMPKKGTLYIIENCSDKIKIDLSLLSLNMTAMCDSYERTSTQYISLCENVGFQFDSETKLNELQTILIFKK